MIATASENIDAPNDDGQALGYMRDVLSVDGRTPSPLNARHDSYRVKACGGRSEPTYWRYG